MAPVDVSSGRPQLHPVTLRFTGSYAGLEAAALETRYWEKFHADALIYVRSASVIGILLYLMALVMDAAALPENYYELRLCVLALCVPAMALMFVATYTPVYRRWPQPTLAACISAVIAGTSLRCFVVDATVAKNLYFAGLTAGLVGLFFVGKLRMRSAALVGLTQAAFYVLGEMRLGYLPPAVQLTNGITLIVLLAFGVILGYSLERGSKIEFLQQLRLNELERRERDRLVGEISLAKNIQNNFLPAAPLPPEAALELASFYMPAAEVAGDWFQYFYDERRGDSIFAVADVSGHGAGSAMFTAIIAGIFDLARARVIESGVPFDILRFARAVDERIYNLGHGDWHVTLLVAAYRGSSDTLEVFNAGHPPPIIIDPARREAPVRLLRQRPSNLLGMDFHFMTNIMTVQVPAGATLLLYTDGLLEGWNISRLVFYLRRLCTGGELSPGTTADELLGLVTGRRRAAGRIAGGLGWRNKAEIKHLDDICLVAVKRKLAAPVGLSRPA